MILSEILHCQLIWLQIVLAPVCQFFSLYLVGRLIWRFHYTKSISGIQDERQELMGKDIEVFEYFHGTILQPNVLAMILEELLGCFYSLVASRQVLIHLVLNGAIR